MEDDKGRLYERYIMRGCKWRGGVREKGGGGWMEGGN